MKKNTTVQFSIDGIPPSANHAHSFNSRTRRIYPLPALQGWRQLVRLTVPEVKIKDAQWYSAEYFFYFPIYNKNGKVKRKDLSNMVKYTEDEVCRKIVLSDGSSLDDSRIKVIEKAEKVDSTELKTIVFVHVLDR